MEIITKRIFWVALMITLIIFLSVLLVANILGLNREQVVDERLNQLSADYKDINTLFLLSEVYGDEFYCIGLQTQLKDLDKSLWDTGAKIENYQEASSTFVKDPYYTKLKTLFNQNLVYYLSLFKNYYAKCGHDGNVILYFYKNSRDCINCDSQSFVLTDIKEDMHDEVLIFSFDTDLGLKSIDALRQFYEIDNYPCLIINEQKHCNLMDKDDILEELCLSDSGDYCQKYLSN